MVRASALCVLVLALASLVTPVALHAQHHAAVHAGGSSVASRPSGSFGPVTPFRNPPVVSFGRSPVIGSRPAVRSAHPVFVAPVGPIVGYGYGYGYYPPYDYYSPYYGYGAGPGYVDPNYSDQQPVYVPGPGDVPAVSQGAGDADLSYQVGRLTQEVQQLRQQQAATQPSAQPATMPVVLIFQDGHQIEIQNYAIIGQTLWVLDERHSTKIPLADLNLDATQRENQSRGLRFSVPSK